MMGFEFINLPAQFENDRIFLCPVTENGYSIKFYTDTGGGKMFIDLDIVKDLKLPIFKKVIENNEEEQFVTFPKFQEKAAIPPGVTNNELHVSSEIPWGQGFLGQNWFAERVWYLDYLNQEMGYTTKCSSFATTGFQSTSIAFKHDGNGTRQFSFPRVQAKVDGEILDFLFDTGATVSLTDTALETLDNSDEVLRGTSFIAQSIYNKWRIRHPEWPFIEYADKLGNGAMIQVPYVEVAGLKSGPVWFTTRLDSNFHKFMSQLMDRQVEGALGGSVFKYFTIIMDYPNSIAYFKK